MADDQPAASTAFGPIVLAAVEQRFAPARRLVTDGLAMSFLPRGLQALVAGTRAGVLRAALIAATERSAPGLWASLVCRKRFIDDVLQAALPDIGAVVVLGAGLDTRAYRFAPHTDAAFYEVDLPVNTSRKRAVVDRVFGGPPATVHLVDVDFERDDLTAALADHGYRADRPTLFIWEGVTQYLSAEAVEATFTTLRGAAAGSMLVFTYIRRDFIEGRNLYGARSLYRRFRRRSDTWKFGINPDEVAPLLERHGWRLVEQAGPEYYLQRYISATGRRLGASDLEWTARAEKLAESG
ncbi:SAM-dependent methyltransferase [Mycolicibacterium sp. S2-37]|uniref:SAM-dependent methyltransferase n=1 Tax=Mycolicibacterium sp. S2-37 TaxID=2810297 RepID=UPI001A951B94|nr:SAM-dependent methyltransferase [Mycolicibacterium sp. S2-37]MBO0677036.1 SAM-dependent methyltransferase [Mycolicibacterium sp. S2-37]